MLPQNHLFAMDCNSVRARCFEYPGERLPRRSSVLNRTFGAALLGLSLLLSGAPKLMAADAITREVVIKQGALVQRFVPAQDVVLVKDKNGTDKFVKIVP